MANNFCDLPFRHKNYYSNGIRYCSNDKGKWYVSQKISLNKEALNGLDVYLVVVKGVPDEFETKETAIKQIENHLKEIIDSGEIEKFRVPGKKNK